MPSLVLFGRRWQIGSDDLVLPSFVDLLFRLAWLLAVGIIYWRNEDKLTCSDPKIFLIGYLGIVHIAIILDATLIQNSRRGSIMETEKRKYVPFFLYLRILIEVLGIGWNTWATVCQFNKNSDCQEPDDTTNLIHCLIIFSWISLFLQLLFLIYCFDPLGASKSRSSPYRNPDEYYKKFPVDIPFGKSKTSKRWENYWKCFCCSWLWCHKRQTDEVKDAFREIAKIFAIMIGDVDLVHSDIVAGLILLAAKNKTNAQKIRHAKAERSRQLVKHTSMDVIKEEPTDWNPAEKENKDFSTSDGWRSPKYLSHFFKYAGASYGWASTMLDRGDSFKRLMKLPTCCCTSNRYPFEIEGDNCCFTNTAGVLDMLQVELKDIIHVSFKSKTFHMPFLVAVDHETKSIVVSIRGTLTLGDAVVDFAGFPAPIPGCPTSFKAHHGMLLTTLRLQKKLDDLQILPKLLKHHPGYQLIFTGHSLGAGCGTILSILSKKQYPSLKCYAFAPPGGLLSKAAAEYCSDFLTSVAYGDDIITRFGVLQFERLKLDLLAVLRECEIPKYQIYLRSLCCYKRKRKVEAMSRTDSSKSTQKLAYINSDADTVIVITDPNQNGSKNEVNASQFSNGGAGYNISSAQAYSGTSFPNMEGMYPPGKIFYISKTHKFNLSYSTWREPVAMYSWRWADRVEFDDIIISSRMLLDHVPFSMPEALHYLSKT